ncbi:MAG: AEC family transporter [Clostridium sp.]|jgi:malate permease and related proteins
MLLSSKRLECIKIENVNSQFILFILIIGLGYTLKRLNIIRESDGDGVSRIIFNVTLPALIINTFDTMKLDTSLVFITITSLLFGILMSIVGLFAFKNEDRTLKGTLDMIVPGFNVGLFAYPIVQAIFGTEGLKYIGMFDMGNSITMFVICYLIASYFSPNNKTISLKTTAKKLITSIPLMCYIITLIVNLCGVHYPSVILNISKILSKGNMPLSLLLLGICLNFNINKEYRKSVIKVLSLRYFIGLAVGIILFRFSPFNNLFKYIVLIGLILPVGMADIPYAVEFGYDKRFVGTMCNITILLSFGLIWIITTLF